MAAADFSRLATRWDAAGAAEEAARVHHAFRSRFLQLEPPSEPQVHTGETQHLTGNNNPPTPPPLLLSCMNTSEFGAGRSPPP